jgi:hypothetical protein
VETRELSEVAPFDFGPFLKSWLFHGCWAGKLGEERAMISTLEKPKLLETLWNQRLEKMVRST